MSRPAPEANRLSAKAYYRRNKTTVLAKAAERRRQLKDAAFAHYGNGCACCGEDYQPFLTIDHIVPAGNRRGSYEKKSLYMWLRSNGYPAGLQTLCWNCNMAKRDRQACPCKERQK